MRWARSRRCCPRRRSRCCARWATWWREASAVTTEGDGVAAAVAAGFLYNLAIVVQKSQAEVVAETGVAILGTLAARPLWILGVALQVLGFFFHAFALSEAPFTVVQPIIASGIAFPVL